MYLPNNTSLKLNFQKAVVMFKAWKDKQVKPRKPEEFDDTESRAVYDAYMAQHHFTSTIDDL